MWQSDCHLPSRSGTVPTMPSSPLPAPPAVALNWRIVDVQTPAGLDAGDEAAVWAQAGLSDIQRDDELATWGWDDRWAPLFVWLPVLQDETYAVRSLSVALRDVPEPRAADVLGAVLLTMPREGNTHLANGYLVVRPDERRNGIGGALLAHGEQIAAAAGRDTLIIRSAEAPEPDAGPGATEAPTGTGRVQAAAPSSRFALRHGFTLEQVERYSVLDLSPGDDALEQVTQHGAAAARVAGEDYRTHVWHDQVPDEWCEALSALMARMNTDAPSGAVELDEEPWDAARVRAYCDHAAHASQLLTITAAEHVPSGDLAAYTILVHPAADVPFAFQEDTLVHAGHRGRRLGMLVKTTNLQALRRRRPGVQRVHTTNAQENEFMLAINTALGFRSAGVHAVWRKRG